jgi:serine/threonine protein kinase
VSLFDVRGSQPLAADAYVYLIMNDAGRSLSSLRKAKEEEEASPPLPPVTLSLPEVKDLAWQMLNAVHYLHAAGFVHRDIKTDNVLMKRLPAPEMGGSRTWRLQLCDLGLARSRRVEGTGGGGGGGGAAALPYATAGTANVVTASYKPMELLGQYGHDTRYDASKVDVFSAGCVLAELFMMVEGGGSNRVSGSVFDPRRQGVARPTWAREEQIKMIVGVLGKPSDVDLAWLKDADPNAYSGVMHALGGVGSAILGGWFGGAAAAAAPEPTLHGIIPAAPPDGLELLRAMFALRPDARASAREAMDNPYFADLLAGPAGGAYRAELAATEEAARKVGEPPELHTPEFNDRTCRTLSASAMRDLLEAELAKWRGK